MAARIWLNIVALIAVMPTHSAFAQVAEPGLTPAGKAILQGKIARGGQLPNDRPGAARSVPVPMCTFPGGLCGAVRRDGTVAVLPRYDWVGPFSDNRAAVRVGGLYGFVDEEGREVVEPQFDEPVYFASRGVGWAKRGERWSAIDRRGRPVPGIESSDTNPRVRSLQFECKVEP